MGLSRRAAGLSRAEAHLYWRTTHADLFRRVPDLVAYVQNHALLDANDLPLLGDVGFDIFSEATFNTAEALQSAVASTYYQTVVLPDERMLLDPIGRSFLVTRQQRAAKLASAVRCKVVAILARQDGSWAELDDMAADLIYPVEHGSGPLGERASRVMQWFCPDTEAAQALHARLMSIALFARHLIAATIVRENSVVASLDGQCPAHVENDQSS
jgi:hypothetical protein